MLLLESQSILYLTNKNEVFKKMMSISKINEIVEENLVIDLEWLKDEFKILFDTKMGNHNEIDKKIANDILDVVFEICMHQKPTILPIHFGEGFFNQVKASSPKVVQPRSMCNALPNTRISEIDTFFKKFGSPIYNIKIEYSDNQPIIKEISLSRESLCGASVNTLEQIRGKALIPDTLNNFALSVRQECREPMSVVFKRDFSETAVLTHLLSLLDTIEKDKNPWLANDKALKDYTFKIRKELQIGGFN